MRMRHLVRTASGIALFVLACLQIPSGEAQQPWCPSKYGPNDKLGAINEITPAKVQQATKLVKEGKVYDMGVLLERGAPAPRSRYWTQMIVRGVPFGVRGKNKLVSIEEVVSGTYQIGTQLDGLAHIAVDNLFYNCLKGEEIVFDWGVTKLGIENVPPVITRGVLVDVAGYKGVPMLEAGYVITVEDLEGALKKQGDLKIEAGDVVIFHTGWLSLWMKDNKKFEAGEPGIGKAVAQWLIDRRVTMVGADNWGLEVGPSEDKEEAGPVHQMLIPQNGIHILENLVTEAMARDRVYEFMFVLTKSKTKGSTAANIAPAAVK
jgi:kynurenine formamidase